MDERITQTNEDPPVFLPKQNLPYGSARERLRVLCVYVGTRRPFTEFEMKEIRTLTARAKVEAIIEKLIAEKKDAK